MALTPTRRIVLGGMAAAAAPHVAFADAPIPVIASFSILGDFVKQVAGDRAGVDLLVGPDRDAHGFSPSPADVRRVGAAKVMVINGLGFEGWADRLVRSAGFAGVRCVATRGLKALAHSGGVDPHAWQDAENIKFYIGNIRQALSEAAPMHAARFQANADAYQAEIDRLHTEIKALFAPIPRERRKVITSHDAFTYFGDAYDVDFLAPQGMSSDSEASPAQVAAIIRQIKRDGVKAVFVENLANPRVIEQIARETGVKIGGTLYADALGPMGSYTAMMRHNAQLLSAALR